MAYRRKATARKPARRNYTRAAPARARRTARRTASRARAPQTVRIVIEHTGMSDQARPDLARMLGITPKEVKPKKARL